MKVFFLLLAVIVSIICFLRIGKGFRKQEKEIYEKRRAEEAAAPPTHPHVIKLKRETINQVMKFRAGRLVVRTEFVDWTQDNLPKDHKPQIDIRRAAYNRLDGSVDGTIFAKFKTEDDLMLFKLTWC